MIELLVNESPNTAAVSGDEVNVTIGIEGYQGEPGPAGFGAWGTISGTITEQADLMGLFVDVMSKGIVASGNYTDIDSTGHQTMHGDARPWRDEKNDALSLRSQGPGVSANVTESVVEFAASADLADYLYCNIQLNHDRDLASILSPHIHFFQAQNAVPNFLVQYRWQLNGGAKVTVWTPLRCNVAAFPYVTGTILQIAEAVSDISPPVGAAVSDIVQFRVLRDTGNASGLFGADPYTGAVGVLSFDAHIQINSIGSTEEYTK